jgi:hypothetical protein
MTLRKLAWVVAFAVMLPAAADAATMGLGNDGPRANGVVKEDATKLVAKSTDPASGAEIRVFTGDGRQLRVEVQDENVFVSKRAQASGIELKVVAGAETMTIALAPEEMSVSGSSGRFRVVAGAAGDLAKARGMIARSTAVTKAVSLLARVRLREDSPLHHAILTTRAWLESAAGPSAAAGELDAWHRGLRQRSVARRVSFDQGPGECWDQYSKEAIRIANDYAECMADVSWYEFFDALACATVYDIRCLGAFAWYLNCIGVLGLF